MTGQHSPTSPAISYDHHDPSFGNDPAKFATIAGGAPVFWTESHGGYWVVAGEELCRQVLADWQTFSSAHRHEEVEGVRYRGVAIPETPIVAGLIEDDPPQWDALRRACAPLLSRRAVEKLRPRVTALANACLERRVEHGRIEFVHDLTGPVPTITTMSMLELPLDSWPRYMHTLHSQAHLAPADAGYADMLAASGELFAELHQLVADRRREPHTDLISRLLSLTRDSQPLSDDEVVTTVFTVLAGGIDTTTSLMSHALYHLGGDSQDSLSLTREPHRLAAAREEFLRYSSPAQHTARTVTRDVTLGGKSLRKGDRLLVSLVAANHDPANRTCPGRLDLDRQPQRHIAFGSGIHRCVGAELARMEFDVVMQAVFDRIPDYRIDYSGALPYPQNPATVNGWIRLPATFTARACTGTQTDIPGLTDTQTAAILHAF